MNLYSNTKSWDRFPGIQSAISTVLLHTEADKKEYGVILSTEGAILAEQQGQETMVDFTPIHEHIKGNVVVHSHPVPVTLSAQDIAMATMGEARAVFAIGSDGSVYQSYGFNKSRTGPEIIDRANRYQQQLVWAAVRDLGMTGDEADAVMQHLCWVRYSAQNILTYSYTLGPVVSEAVAGFETIMRQRGLDPLHGINR